MVYFNKIFQKRASHIRLKKGVISRNSPISVLCPILASNRERHEGLEVEKAQLWRPQGVKTN